MYNQGYPPSQGGYPPAGGYPPQTGAYPPGGYPPQTGAYPPAGGYPSAGGYPPQTGAYPPAGGAYPPQSGPYPPASGSYSSAGAYPPQGPYGREPVYRQITVGRGINMNEFNSIVGCVKQTYMTGVQPMANTAAENIRRTLGGDWFVFISDVGIEDYDFSMTRVKGGDFIAFSLDSKKFQVCRIR